jgi:hypothetical protein
MVKNQGAFDSFLVENQGSCKNQAPKKPFFDKFQTL